MKSWEVSHDFLLEFPFFIEENNWDLREETFL